MCCPICPQEAFLLFITPWYSQTPYCQTASQFPTPLLISFLRLKWLIPINTPTSSALTHRNWPTVLINPVIERQIKDSHPLTRLPSVSAYRAHAPLPPLKHEERAGRTPQGLCDGVISPYMGMWLLNAEVGCMDVPISITSPFSYSRSHHSPSLHRLKPEVLYRRISTLIWNKQLFIINSFVKQVESLFRSWKQTSKLYLLRKSYTTIKCQYC